MPLLSGRGFDATNYAVVAFYQIPQFVHPQSPAMKAQIGRAKQTGKVPVPSSDPTGERQGRASL
jgi:hypothetical protein